MEEKAKNPPLPNTKCPALRIQDVYLKEIINDSQAKPEQLKSPVGKVIGKKKTRGEAIPYEDNTLPSKGKPRGNVIIGKCIPYPIEGANPN